MGQITSENYDEFMSSWYRAPNWRNCVHVEEFRYNLSERFRSEINYRESNHAYIAWETPRPVPGVRSAHRTLILLINGDRGAMTAMFKELKELIKPTDVALAFRLGRIEFVSSYAKVSGLPILVLEDKAAMDLFIGGRAINEILLKEVEKRSGEGLWRIVNPYAAHGPVQPSMFYGRRKERSQLLSDSSRAVAVIGARGIGKSSLMLQVKELAPQNDAAIYVNCEVCSTPEKLQTEVSKSLFPRPYHAGTVYELHELHKHTSRRVLLLLDEADPLIEFCDKHNRSEFYGQIKWAAASGQVKVILAGFREFRDAVLDANHPIYNHFQKLELGPLELPEAFDLIVEPMKELGMSFGGDEHGAVQRIFNWSSGHPLYIQTYCHRLVSHCISKDVPVDADSMETVERDPQIYGTVIATFIQTTNALEKCVAYTAMDIGGYFTPTAIAGKLSQTWRLDLGVNEVMKTCDRLVVANVFTRGDQGYCFLFSAFPELLRSHERVDQLMPQMIKDAKRVITVR